VTLNADDTPPHQGSYFRVSCTGRHQIWVFSMGSFFSEQEKLAIVSVPDVCYQ